MQGSVQLKSVIRDSRYTRKIYETDMRALLRIECVDSPKKLLYIESQCARIKRVEFNCITSGECTMYVAWTATDAMAVYVGAGIATAVPAMGDATLLLKATAEWLHQQHVKWLFVAPASTAALAQLEAFLSEQGVASKERSIVIEQTIIKTAKTGEKVMAMRGKADGLEILYKLRHRKKKWNTIKTKWVKARGQVVDRPRWSGSNAFVADLSGVKIVMLETAAFVAAPLPHAPVAEWGERAPPLRLPVAPVRIALPHEPPEDDASSSDDD